MGVPPTAPRRNGNGSLTGHCRFPSESGARFPPLQGSERQRAHFPGPRPSRWARFFCFTERPLATRPGRLLRAVGADTYGGGRGHGAVVGSAPRGGPP